MCTLITSEKKIDKDYEVKLIHTKPGMGFIFKMDL